MSLFRASGGNKFKIVNGGAKVRVAESKVLYFNGAIDSDWNTLGNWWLDSSFTIPATHLPRSIDSVIASANISINSGSSPTVQDFTLNDPEANYYSLSITIAVIGIATFNDYAYITSFNLNTGSSGYIVGDVIFNGFSSHQGTVVGNVTFNNYSFNDGGAINGDAIFNDVSSNIGIITGNATFNNASNNTGTVTGDGTFNSGTANYGNVTGNATFNDSSFNDNGIVTGDATFNDSSYNNGTINGDATFNGISQHYSSVTGTATFNDSSCNNGTAGTFIPDPPPSCF